MKYITVHCSASRPNQFPTVEDIRAEHLRRGFSDVGYHWVINRKGTISKGRSESRGGAHVKGHNRNNIGICLVGGLDEKGKPECNFTEAQYSSLRYLITDKISQYGIPLENIKGHRDWYGDTNGDGVINRYDWMKECPCFSVRDTLKKWNE